MNEEATNLVSQLKGETIASVSVTDGEFNLTTAQGLQLKIIPGAKEAEKQGEAGERGFALELIVAIRHDESV